MNEKRTTKPSALKPSEEIVAYKGFDKDFKCRDHQYEVGKRYDHKGEVQCCASGYHSCEYPLDVFGYYQPSSSRFAIVRATGTISRNGEDSKFSSSALTIEAEVHIPQLVAAAVQYILSRLRKTNKMSATNTGNWSAATNTGYRRAATNTGNWSAATNTGNWSAATNTGYRSAATNTGNWSAATNTGNQSAATNTGDQSAATNTGNWSAATNTGNWSAATNTGDWSAATNTGDQSAATNTGDWSAATNTGYRSAATNTGDQSAATIDGDNKAAVAVASGYKSKAKAGMGSAIVCVYRNEAGSLIHIRAAIAGTDVKPDTWYTLDEKGNFIEV